MHYYQKWQVICLAFFSGLCPLWGQQYVFSTLAPFDGTNGAGSIAPLILASDGNLYGTSVGGGTNGQGTIFKLSPYGGMTGIYSFSGGNDGAGPRGGLIQGRDGLLYGTSRDGGTNGLGSVFKITTNGNFKALYSFSGNDGSHPYASLSAAPDGSFFGTTYDGGSNDLGTVFQIATNGVLTPLYNFSGSDGANPYGGVVLAADGNLYGTTLNGGVYGAGSVFRLSLSGMLMPLFDLSGGYEGGNPYAGLTETPDGNLVGTTYYGGGGYGTAFILNPPSNTWFDGQNGANPKAGITIGPGGFFYTAAENGGTNSAGSVVQIASDGTITLLHSFSGGTDGGTPDASLLWDQGVSFYGTASTGGAFGFGTVYRLTQITFPVIQSLMVTNGRVALNFTAIPGQNYQLRFAGDAGSTIWSSLGGTITATNSIMSTSDGLGAGRRFYRVELVVP